MIFCILVFGRHNKPELPVKVRGVMSLGSTESEVRGSATLKMRVQNTHGAEMGYPGH